MSSGSIVEASPFMHETELKDHKTIPLSELTAPVLSTKYSKLDCRLKLHHEDRIDCVFGACSAIDRRSCIRRRSEDIVLSRSDSEPRNHRVLVDCQSPRTILAVEGCQNMSNAIHETQRNKENTSGSL
ncbi:hypothetical protein RRG08_006722 [Elysia crispata]|uniref:Uncharacterized protein n=1 Tax=Elysia crispata TaxID=231223 RepID=A0AAE1BE36_9GAST|nr:hypothetical protein RRG08_006722 [Elysia crispata]